MDLYLNLIHLVGIAIATICCKNYKMNGPNKRGAWRPQPGIAVGYWLNLLPLFTLLRQPTKMSMDGKNSKVAKIQRWRMVTITYGIPVEKWPKPGATVRFFGPMPSRKHGHKKNTKWVKA